MPSNVRQPLQLAQLWFHGFGIIHHGKDNLVVTRGVCPRCGCSCDYYWYDTLQVLVILLLPVWPLVRKRVLGECSKCGDHRIIRLKEWKQRKNEQLAAAVEAFRTNPGDADAALTLLFVIAQYQDERPLSEWMPFIARHHERNAEVQDMMGAALQLFNRHTEAEQCFRRSLAACNNSDVRERLALSLIAQCRPSDAFSLITHIFEEKKVVARWLALYLIECYQAAATHSHALDACSRFERAFPSLDIRELQNL